MKLLLRYNNKQKSNLLLPNSVIFLKVLNSEETFVPFSYLISVFLTLFSVWQKLEEENQVFFKQYHIRLILKDQILRFNELLDKQAKMMKQMSPANGAASVPINDGTRIPSCKILNTVTVRVGFGPKPKIWFFIYLLIFVRILFSVFIFGPQNLGRQKTGPK